MRHTDIQTPCSSWCSVYIHNKYTQQIFHKAVKSYRKNRNLQWKYGKKLNEIQFRVLREGDHNLYGRREVVHVNMESGVVLCWAKSILGGTEPLLDAGAGVITDYPWLMTPSCSKETMSLTNSNPSWWNNSELHK